MSDKGQQEVVRYIADLEDGWKEAVTLLRDVILSSRHPLTEHIKWNAPSFCHNGDDRITLGMGPKRDFIRVILHRGAKVKAMPDANLIEDPDGILRWAAKDRAVMQWHSAQEIQQNRAAIVRAVDAWIDATP